MELLRDPLWAGLGAIIAVAGIFVSTIVALKIFQKQRVKRSIIYSLSAYALFRVREEVEDSIEVLFHGRPIGNAAVVVIKVSNSGNEPIVPSSFIEPIKFNFGPQSEIIDAQITETKPDKLPVSITTNPNELVITPTLLNEEDSFFIKLIIKEFEDYEVTGRIVGVKSIQDDRKEKLEKRSLPLLVELPTLWKAMILTSFTINLIIIAMSIYLAGYLIEHPPG